MPPSPRQPPPPSRAEQGGASKAGRVTVGVSAPANRSEVRFSPMAASHPTAGAAGEQLGASARARGAVTSNMVASFTPSGAEPAARRERSTSVDALPPLPEGPPGASGDAAAGCSRIDSTVAAELTAEAVARGNKDNVTVGVVQFEWGGK